MTGEFSVKVGKLEIHSLHPNNYPAGGEVSISVDEGISKAFKFSSMGTTLLVQVDAIDDLIAVLVMAKAKINNKKVESRKTFTT